MLLLVRQAIENDPKENFELDKNIVFYCGEIQQLLREHKNKFFDTVFVPYLLGVENGIEARQDIIHFVEQLIQVVPHGYILITPSRSNKEFRITGKRFFVTTGYASIQAIPELQKYIVREDPHWLETQGLVILGVNHGQNNLHR
jgi:hypothetical protein